MYTYEPLSEGSIRLIHLLPSEDNHSLRCQLRQHKLTKDLEYDALSYTWGQPVFDSCLYISRQRSCEEASPTTNNEQPEAKWASDHNSLITPSLHSALHRVRQRNPGKPVIIWADAVCINQADIPERNVQIKLIKKIYEYAATTWIDLGEERDGSQHIPNFIGRMLERVPTQIHGDYRDYRDGKGDYYTEGPLPSSSGPEWPPINALVRRPWFGRVWIIQEAAVASMALMMCGDWTLPLDDFGRVLAAARFQAWDNNNETKSATSLGMSRVRSLGLLRAAVRNSKELDLMDLIRHARSSLATKPVDYIYAMLGLSSYRDAPELAPDYAEPLPITLKRYAEFFIEKGQAFDMLMYVDQSHWAPDQPTWIPSWTQPGERRSSWDDCMKIPFEAASDITGEIAWADDQETNTLWLVMKGVAVDIVDRLGKDQREANTALAGAVLDDLPREVLKEQVLEPVRLMEMGGHSTSFYPVPEVMRGGPGVDGDGIAVNGNSDFDKCCHMIVTDNWPKVQDASFKDQVSSMIQTISHLLKTTNWSRVAVTTNGMLGRVPHGTRKGDIVTLFAGANVPFVLRQRPAGEVGFQVVGACYMHGIMFGEIDYLMTEESKVDFILT